MKILTEKQFNKLLYERQCETERRFHEIGELGNRFDLCEECYEKFIAWLKAERKEE